MSQGRLFNDDNFIVLFPNNEAGKKRVVNMRDGTQTEIVEPDLNGNGKVGGVEFWAKGFKKTSKKGNNYVFVKVNPKIVYRGDDQS